MKERTESFEEAAEFLRAFGDLILEPPFPLEEDIRGLLLLELNFLGSKKKD